GGVWRTGSFGGGGVLAGGVGSGEGGAGVEAGGAGGAGGATRATSIGAGRGGGCAERKANSRPACAAALNAPVTSLRRRPARLRALARSAASGRTDIRLTDRHSRRAGSPRTARG